MRNDAFQSWRREREAVEQEMDLLITAGLPASSEERQIRRTRFAALLERREAAARNLLHSGWARRRDASPNKQPSEPPSEPSNEAPSAPWRPGDLLVATAHVAGAGAEGEQATFVPLPDGRATADVETADVNTADVKSEPPEPVGTAATAFDAVALALDAATPPAEPDTGSTADTGSSGSVAADVAELPSDVVALAPDAALPPGADAVPAAAPPADVPEPAAEEAALAPDAAAPSAEPAEVLAQPVALATPADAAPPAANADVAAAPAPDDLRPDALLMKLLRRLKPN